ncbi:hypothetical protein [Streptomyces sp. T028]|uniref:hypothetical protein n=1 Tax=Streptomyces sp. T028 TaxID=3394379 RepID=UPI003A873AA6
MPTPEAIWDEADLPTRRLAGLALNPATSEDVLLRLLADAPLAARMVLCRDRDLPGAVVDAVIDHPDTCTRSFLARNPHVDPAQRARLVDDEDWFVRAHLSEGPRTTGFLRPRPLPDETVVHMLTTYTNEELGNSVYRQFSDELRRALPTHPDPRVRVWGGARDEKFKDPVWVESNLPDRPCHARTFTLMNLPLTRAVVDGVLTAPAGPEERSMIADNPSLPSDVVVLLASDPDPEVRKSIACREDLRPEQLRALAVDPEPKVRLAVSVHPAWSEEERAGIDYEVPMDEAFGFYPKRLWPRDPEAVRQDALSGHPMLRRRAAKEHELPPDLVGRLAVDDDLGVRVLLAQNHPDAPADLVLRSFLEYTGWERDHLLTRPRFPTDGLAVYADHEDPAVRALAARDPRTPPEVVERLTRDPDPGVRAALARHPNLPSARLAELLDDEELVQHAAANPALGVEAIRRLVAAALPVS